MKFDVIVLKNLVLFNDFINFIDCVNVYKMEEFEKKYKVLYFE